jgi:hypothetical protein
MQAITIKKTNKAIEDHAVEIFRERGATEKVGCQLMAVEQQAMVELEAQRTSDTASREDACLPMVEGYHQARKVAEVVGFARRIPENVS